MKATILQVDATPNKKTQDMNYSMTILSDFVSYGQIRPATAQVKLDADTYQKYLQMQGKEVTLDVLISVPDFPLQLRK